MIQLETKGMEAPADLLRRLGKGAPAAVSLATMACAQHAESEIKKSVLQNLKKNPTGHLMESFTATMIKQTGDEVSAGALSPVIYAGIHNEGGTIRSKRGPKKMLAIPMDPSLKGKWPREFARTALKIGFAPIPYRLGLVLENTAGKILYNLARKVEIPATHYIDKAAKKAEPEYGQIFEDELNRLIELAEEESAE